MNTAAIDAEGLVKVFGENRAVDGSPRSVGRKDVPKAVTPRRSL